MPNETEWLYQSHTEGAEQGPKVLWFISGLACFPLHQMILVDLFEYKMTYIT